ncbi:site-specific recombinase [Streptomyces sp. NPDC002701]|uniref:site-specific recombinase n=1 Tax=Streptomyces sp. NPDC002701 TaxID=3364661 RepID=UPI00369964ED
MTIEPVAELGSGGALRLPRARVVPLSVSPSSYTAAVERYLTGAGIAKSSARIYRISLTTWGWMLAGERAPTGPARRGAKPPVFPVAAVDDPALPEVLAELAAARADEMDADAVNRELSIARKASGWWQRQGWIGADPTIGIEQRPAPPDRNRRAPAGTPTLDVCPETGRARLSYRRAEEIFEENTRLLANPLASPEDVEDLDGWTLHRLRHSALTHDAEDGTSTPMLLARSRHASVRSLERYARPGVASVARHVAERDPAARRRM